MGEEKLKKIVFIVGMHRTGTSCLANMFIDNGYWAGQTNNGNLRNERGYGENFKFAEVNDKFLGPDWTIPLNEVRVTEETVRIVEDFLTHIPSGPIVLKNPVLLNVADNCSYNRK